MYETRPGLRCTCVKAINKSRGQFSGATRSEYPTGTGMLWAANEEIKL